MRCRTIERADHCRLIAENGLKDHKGAHRRNSEPFALNRSAKHRPRGLRNQYRCLPGASDHKPARATVCRTEAASSWVIKRTQGLLGPTLPLPFAGNFADSWNP